MGEASVGLTTVDDTGSMHIRNWYVPADRAEAFAAQMTAVFGQPDEMISDLEAMNAGGQRIAAEGRATYLLRSEEGAAVADPLTREIGRVEIATGSPAVVGINHGMVTLGLPGIVAQLSTETADELTAHLITAIWQAQQDEDGNPGQRRPLPAVEHISGGLQLAAGDPPTLAASTDGGGDG